MISLTQTLFYGTLGLSAGYVSVKLMDAIIGTHEIDHIFYSLPFG